MNDRTTGKWLLLGALIVLCGNKCPTCIGDETERERTTRQPPHIMFVLIDDLGWGDVGFHQPSGYENLNRQSKVDPREVQTPVMDQLVQDGLELRRHYVHCTCTGTRTALQSGRFPVHVQTSLKYPEDPSSGMPRNLTGLAEHLKHSSNHAAYATHYVGKWDAGMASPKHTPKGRGYDTSLNYFEHKNDFWTQECAQSECCHRLLRQQGDEKQDPTTASSSSSDVLTSDFLIKDLWDTDRPARDLAGTDYEEFIFRRRMLTIIDDHAAIRPQDPLFLFYAPHVAHCPLQVPQSYLDQFDFMENHNDEAMCEAQTANILRPDAPNQPPYSCRKQYRAMVKLLDDILGSLVERLKQNGMWEDTIMIVTSDNGGPVDPRESGATNFPLRGGKYSDWEGGVRATAFVSGGYLPPDRRGKVLHDPIHICDWYATLPALAGVDVREEETKASSSSSSDKSRIPPVDAVNVWPLILGTSEGIQEDSSRHLDSTMINDGIQEDSSRHPDSSMTNDPPRIEIPLSGHALIIGDYKLLWNEHNNISIAGWTPEDYPNGQTGPSGINNDQMNCTAGCLFNVHVDPGEHNNLAAKKPFRVQQMKRRLETLRKGFFENDDKGVDSCPHGYKEDGDDFPCACWMAVNYYGGFLGPYQEVDIHENLALETP
jgi:arylsulfatase A-like enzyme